MRQLRLPTLLLAVLAAVPARALAAPFAYVANHGEDDVSVVDTATNATVATIPVGTQPYGVAVDPEGTHVYVGNLADNTVSVLTTATNGVVTVPVGDEPTGIAVKLPGNRVYVANRNDRTVSVIDPATNQVVTTIAVGANPMGIAVNPAGTPAYVVNKGDDSMSVIDTSTNQVLTTIGVDATPTHVAVSPAGDRIYVTNNTHRRVTIVNAATLGVTGTINVGSFPEGVAFSPDGTRAYVVNSGPETLSVIDTASATVLTTIPVGSNAEDVAVHPDGSRVYVLNRGGSSVSVIDTASNVQIDTDGDSANGVTPIAVGFSPVARGQALMPGFVAPHLGKHALGCQAAIAAQARSFAKTDQGQRATCESKILKALSTGKDSEAIATTCALALDVGRVGSPLAKARDKARASIVKTCFAVDVATLDRPCKRDATSIGEAAGCILDQHETRVSEMVAATVGDDTTPMTKAAVACQATIAKGAAQLAQTEHAALDGCLVQILKDAATQKTLATSAPACAKALDPNDPKTAVAKIRAGALAKIAKKCSGLTPAAIGAPCDPTATTIAQTTACVFASHTMRVEKMVAAEFNDACPLLTAVGLGRAYPDVCSGH